MRRFTHSAKLHLRSKHLPCPGFCSQLLITVDGSRVSQARSCSSLAASKTQSAKTNSAAPSTLNALSRSQKTTGQILFRLYHTPGSTDGKPLLSPAQLSAEKQQLISIAETQRAEPGDNARSDDAATVNLLVAYLRDESRAEKVLEFRRRQRRPQPQSPRTRLSPLELMSLVRHVTTLVEERRVSLVVATRVLRVQWPRNDHANGAVSVQHRYLQQTLLAWIAEDLRERRTLAADPAAARAVLDNVSFACRSGAGSALVGPLATAAIADLARVQHPDAVIAVMWSVHAAGTHAPADFWRATFGRLVELNRELRGSMAGVIATAASGAGGAASRSWAWGGTVPNNSRDYSTGETTQSETDFNAEEDVVDGAVDDNEGSTGESSEAASLQNQQRQQQTEKPPRQQRAPERVPPGHVFSGLTTRQIFRTLEVLRLEKWSGSSAEMHELADQALKNIVFETEAANFAAPSITAEGGAPVPSAGSDSRRVIAYRLSRVADLSRDEFLTLLRTCGDLGVSFNISADRVCDALLVPMVAHTTTEELLLLSQVTRQTRCHSPQLVLALALKLESRGLTAPYALPLAKSLVWSILHERQMLAQVDLAHFVNFFLNMCELYHTRVRASELESTAEVLYGLSRRFHADSPAGLRVRRTMDAFCDQVDRLLRRDLVPLGAATRLLEYTIVMDMRPPTASGKFTKATSESGGHYPGTLRLLATRNAIAERRNALREERSLITVSELSRGITEHTEPPVTGASPTSSAVAQSPGTKRWENVPEADLPSVPRAAVDAYNELVYMYERMAVLKVSISPAEMSRFTTTIAQSGLYNLLLGSCIFSELHLSPSGAVAEKSFPAIPGRHDAAVLPNAIPAWMEKTVNRVVMEKLSKTAPRADMSDSALLHFLGHVHCDAAKVRKLVELLQACPLHLLRSQRELWDYVRLLATRFGSAEELDGITRILQKTHY